MLSNTNVDSFQQISILAGAPPQERKLLPRSSLHELVKYVYKETIASVVRQCNVISHRLLEMVLKLLERPYLRIRIATAGLRIATRTIAFTAVHLSLGDNWPKPSNMSNGHSDASDAVNMGTGLETTETMVP